MMAAGVVLLVAAVLVVHGAHASIPPKFIKASYGVHKALYAKNYGYSLRPLPAHITVQAHPPKTLPLVGDVPVVTARKGRGYKYYRGRRPTSTRRRKRPSAYPKRRRPSTYGLPVYATKYKNYIPSSRRPPYSRYKKKRPYRPSPPRRPPPYRDVHPDIDEYEQEIPDDYEDYDSADHGNDHEYSYFDIPSAKRLPLQYEKEFVNRHADLYNGGYNPGLPNGRGRYRDTATQYSHVDQVRTRVRFQKPKQEHHDIIEPPDKHSEESQDNQWPGEVANEQDSWDSPPSVGRHWQDQPGHWDDHDHIKALPQQSSHEWHNHPRPPRQDNQWQVYPTQQSQQPQVQPQAQQFQWPPRPTRAPEVRGWTTSLRPKPLSAAVAVPSRPVVPREEQQQASNHRQVYNWDPATNSYQLVERDVRPRYQAHYSEADFNYHQYRGQDVDRKSDSHRSNRAYSVPDIGFGEGMEVVDDGVAGWKVDT